MRSDPTREQREACYHILAYLMDNPDAGDTFEGIVEWWLLHQRIKFETETVSEAVAKIIPLSALRYIGSSHHEQDEDGALNEFLAAAPRAVPICSEVGAMINADGMDRPPRALRDGEQLAIGKRLVTWYDAPHLPHGWETGYIYESTNQVLFCGDILTQPGPGDAPITESDIIGPAEEFRKALDYFSHGSMAPTHLRRLAGLEPKTLACMHGSAWLGDGGALLIELASLLSNQD